MKVRIGVSSGPETIAGEELGRLVRDLEDRGFDSLWMPEILTAPGADPLTGLAYVAGQVDHLKLGTTLVLPGRNPVRLAQQLATLDRLSGGRLLVTFVLGLNRPRELAALGVDAGERGARADELLPLLRRLWTGEPVDHEGPHWSLPGVTVSPRPLQDPLEAWFGGTAPSAWRRTGRLADGWLPSFCTPAEAATGRVGVEEAAAEAGRTISPEHYGVTIGYLDSGAPADLLHRLGSPRKPLDPAAVPVGLPALRARIEAFLEVGFSKFVVRPILPPESWPAELDRLADTLLDLQT